MKRLFFLAFFPITIFAQTKEKDLITYLDSTMTARQIPGMSIAVIENKKVHFRFEKGLANVELNSKINSNSVYELASLTKPFTALTVLKLAEQNLLDLDSSIIKYIDDAPKEWKGITIKHLLTQSSGFAEQIILAHGFSPVMDVTTKDQFDLIVERPLMFEAGEKGQYSDPGYFLLGMIIEKVTGKAYSQFISDEVFNPSDMNKSQIQNKWEIIKNRVNPYTIRQGKLLNGRRDYQHELPSHFGIISTLNDLISFDNMLRQNKLLSKQYKDIMFTSGKLNSGEDVVVWGENYGSGWMLGEVNGERYAQHGGFTGTHLLHFIDRDLTIVVLTNLDVRSKSNPRQIAHYIAEKYLVK